MMARHLVTYLLPNIAQAVASFGTVALLTRLLGEADYGRYALVFTAMSLANYLALTWIEAAAARYFSEANARGEKPDHFKTLLRLYAWCAAGFGVISVLLVVLLPYDVALKLALAAAFAGVIVRSFIRIALETRRMALQATRYSLVESLHTILGFALTAVCIGWLGLGEEGAFIGLLVASVMVLVIEGPALWVSQRGGTFQPERAKAYLAFGAPAAFSLVMMLAMTSADRFVIASVLDEAAVGAYSAGYQVGARVLDLVAVWVSSAMFPLIAAAYDNEGVEAAKRQARAAFALRLGIGAPAAVGLALVATPLCDILIGPALREEAAAIARWIALAALLACMAEYFAEAFILAKKALQRALLMIVPVSVNIGLNLVLLPVWGLNGAVVSTVVAYAVGLVLLAVVGRRYIALPIPLEDIAKVGFACGCMALFVSLLPDWGGVGELVFKAALGAAVYGLVALLLDIANAKSRLSDILGRLMARTGAA
jgi:O-antigen/teichoic acid export membrane protein